MECAGSSPRMRGKRRSRAGHRFIKRLIPAHAGKTIQHRCILQVFPAHPRACGENFTHFEAPTSIRGSSPRMRGKPVFNDRIVPARGLIPAHAGKTARMVSLVVICRAHPRACGENDGSDRQGRSQAGSSPRMRGKLFVTIGRALRHRLIPAHAGKTGSDRPLAA